MKTINNSTQRFKNNVKWQFFSNASQIVIGGLYILALGRLLGSDAFGVYSIVMAIVTVFGLFTEMKLQELVVRDFCDIFDAEKKQTNSKIIDLYALEILGRALPMILIIGLAYPIVHYTKLSTDNIGLLCLASIGIFFSKSGYGVSIGILRVLGRSDIIAGCSAADWGMRLIFVLIIELLFGLNVAAVLWISLVIGFVCNMVQTLFALYVYNECIEQIDYKSWTFSGLNQRLSTSKRLIFSNLGLSTSDMMAKDLDVALIANSMSSEKVGIYKMSKTIVQILWRGIDPILLSILPEIQRIFNSGDIVALKKIIKEVSIRMLFLSLVLYVIGCAGVNLFWDDVLGEDYRGISICFPIMAIWVTFSAGLIWAPALSISIGRPEFNFYGSALGLFIGLISFSFLVPAYDLYGAGIAWDLTIIASFIVPAFLARKILLGYEINEN